MWTLISELRDNTIHSHTHTEILVTNSNTFFATYNSLLCVRFINKCNYSFELILCRVIVPNTAYLKDNYPLHRQILTHFMLEIRMYNMAKNEPGVVV